MTQQVTGRIGFEGAGQGPYGWGPGAPGWDVVPTPRPAPGPHPAPAPVRAAAPYVPVATLAPVPPASPGAPHPLVVVALTVVALAVLTLVGVLLYPWVATPGTVVTAVPAAAPTTVVVPAPASSGSSSGSSSGAYSCGSANGYAIEVQNGNVPCTSARWVTTMWTTDGTTPMNGAGPAGTPYSWSCSSTATSTEVGSCVSRMGSTFTITR